MNKIVKNRWKLGKKVPKILQKSRKIVVNSVKIDLKYEKNHRKSIENWIKEYTEKLKKKSMELTRSHEIMFKIRENWAEIWNKSKTVEL